MGSNKNILVLFDFDYTIINENSDTWIVKEISKELFAEMEILKKTVQWTQLMGLMVKRLALEHNKSVEELEKCITSIPLTPHMKNIFELIRKRRQEVQADTHVYILSDANSHFIDWFLKHNQVQDCVDKVFTNPCRFDEELKHLVIEPYCPQSSPHQCKACPENICKGELLDVLRKRNNSEEVAYDQIVYVGDGFNDFCPSTRLRAKESSNDILFVREGYSLEKLLNRQHEPNSTFSNKVLSHIEKWKDHQQLCELFSKHVFQQ